MGAPDKNHRNGQCHSVARHKVVKQPNMYALLIGKRPPAFRLRLTDEARAILVIVETEKSSCFHLKGTTLDAMSTVTRAIYDVVGESASQVHKILTSQYSSPP